ncbi:hypothetical protein [Geobacter sp.]|nr:hypothetical protein [Geobacter sp.]
MVIIICEKNAPEEGCHGRRATIMVPRWLGRLLLRLGRRWR